MEFWRRCGGTGAGWFLPNLSEQLRRRCSSCTVPEPLNHDHACSGVWLIENQNGIFHQHAILSCSFDLFAEQRKAFSAVLLSRPEQDQTAQQQLDCRGQYTRRSPADLELPGTLIGAGIRPLTDPFLYLVSRVHALRLSRTSAFLDRTKHLRSRFEVWFSVQSLNLLIDRSAFFWRQLRQLLDNLG